MRIPRLVEGVKITSLPLDPFEGFVLSRVDGLASVEDIADTTGGDPDQVRAILAKLEELGAIQWNEESVSERGMKKISSAPPEDGGAKEPAEPTKPAREIDGRAGARGQRISPTPGRGIVRTKPIPEGASRVLYDPAELEEDVDLDDERRRMILDTFYRLDELDHYALLGIERDADKKVIRAAYFRLSKQFHPDTLFGKRLGSYKQKMEAVFKRLTDAYDVLGKKKRRAKYDEYLEAKDQVDAVARRMAAGEQRAHEVEHQVTSASEAAVVMPEATEKAPAEKARAEKAPAEKPSVAGGEAPLSRSAYVPPRPSAFTKRPDTPKSEPPPADEAEPELPPADEAREPELPIADEAPASGAPEPDPATSGRADRLSEPESPPVQAEASASDSAPTSGPSSARAPVDPAARKRRARELLERRLRGATGRPSVRSKRPDVPKDSGAGDAAPPSRDTLLKGLATSLKRAARHTGGVDRVERHLADAREAEDAGDLVGALNALRLAHALEARDEIQLDIDRLQHLVSKDLAATYERQARYEEENGEWAAAARSWQKVVEGRPDKAEPARRAAAALVEADGDLRVAKDLAQRAVELAPKSLPARILLGRIFIAAGMKANAKRELEEAAKLDPKDEIVKNLLRELK